MIQEQHRGQYAMKVHITPDIVSDMVVRGQFKMKVRVALSNKLANTEILLSLGRDGLFPISRFPRSLLEDGQVLPSMSTFRPASERNMKIASGADSAQTEVRQQTEVNLNRWAGRTPSQQLRRKDWRAPDLANEPRPAKIATYSSREYVIGDSTQNKLRRMATRLINGPSPQPATAIDEVEREAEDMRQRISAAEMDMERNLYAFELSGEDIGPAELPGPEPLHLYSPQKSQLVQEPEPQAKQAEGWPKGEDGRSAVTSRIPREPLNSSHSKEGVVAYGDSPTLPTFPTTGPGPTAFETPQITVNEPQNLQSFPKGVAELETPFSDEATRQRRDKMYTGQGKMHMLTLTEDRDPDGRRTLRSSPASTRKSGISGDGKDFGPSSRLGNF